MLIPKKYYLVNETRVIAAAGDIDQSIEIKLKLWQKRKSLIQKLRI